MTCTAETKERVKVQEAGEGGESGKTVKKAIEQSSSVKKERKRKAESDEDQAPKKEAKLRVQGIFSELTFRLYPPGGSNKTQVPRLEDNGARIHTNVRKKDAISNNITHVVVCNDKTSLQKVKKFYKDIPEAAEFVTYKWCSDSIERGRLVKIAHDHRPPDRQAKTAAENQATCIILPSGPIDPSERDIVESKMLLMEAQELFPDELKSAEARLEVPDGKPNIWVETAFSVYYEFWKLSSDPNSRFREYKYQAAMRALGKQTQKVMSACEAKAIGVGDRLAGKIEELVTEYTQSELEDIRQDDKLKSLTLFAGVHGIGAKTAQKLYNDGYRTLEELWDIKSKFSQTIQYGLEYYDDFKKKIPRKAVEAHFKVVEAAVNQINADDACWIGRKAQAHCMGSYRRGKSMCGDIDVMLLIPKVDDEEILSQLKETLVARLKEQGFLKFTLVGLHNEKKHSCRWLGASTIGKDDEGLVRRLDIFAVPWKCRGAAMLHCTGSAALNIKMATKALRRGWKLTESGLYCDSRTPRERADKSKKHDLTKERLVAAETEESIFEALEMEYVPPEQRNQ